MGLIVMCAALLVVFYVGITYSAKRWEPFENVERYGENG